MPNNGKMTKTERNESVALAKKRERVAKPPLKLGEIEKQLLLKS